MHLCLSAELFVNGGVILEKQMSLKLETLLKNQHGIVRTRDFLHSGISANYEDIYTLLSTNEFDGRVLFEAVSETVQHRGTPLEKKSFILKGVFLRRRSQDIRAFLQPIYNHLLLKEEFFGKWNCNDWLWIVPNFQSGVSGTDVLDEMGP